jgi:MFS family permease
MSDRARRHKLVAGAGYAASALSRVALLFATGSGGLTAATALDRVGKGIRTAPRDALISLSVQPAALASAFGVHRTLDTAGAVLGPLVAFALLRRFADGYDVVFVVSVALALVACAVLATFVRDVARHPDDANGPRDAGVRAALASDPRFRRLAIAAGALGMATLSDSFVYLVLQQRTQFSPVYLPLLYVATPGAYMLFALPAGWLADRQGRMRTLLAGYAALIAAYAVAVAPPAGPWTVAGCVALLGLFYAATDGVMMALASAALPADRRATGLSIVGTANGAGKIAASLVFGWLWTVAPASVAVGLFAVALALTVVALVTLPTWRLLGDAHA